MRNSTFEGDFSGKNQQQKGYNKNTPHDTSDIKVKHAYSSTSLIKNKEIYKDIIPYPVNAINDLNIAGETKAATNQATDILEKKLDKDLTWATFSENSINNNLTDKKAGVNGIQEKAS